MIKVKPIFKKIFFNLFKILFLFAFKPGLKKSGFEQQLCFFRVKDIFYSYKK